MTSGSRSEERDWSVHVTEDGDVVPRTWASVRDGLVPWESLDAEELVKGKLRDRLGGFRGTRGLCPPDLQRAMVAEHVRRATDEFRTQLLPAVRTLRDVADGTVPASAGEMTAAAKYIIERVMGPVPQKLEAQVSVKPWEGVIEGILVDAPPRELEGD